MLMNPHLLPYTACTNSALQASVDLLIQQAVFGQSLATAAANPHCLQHSLSLVLIMGLHLYLFWSCWLTQHHHLIQDPVMCHWFQLYPILLPLLLVLDLFHPVLETILCPCPLLVLPIHFRLVPQQHLPLLILLRLLLVLGLILLFRHLQHQQLFMHFAHSILHPWLLLFPQH